MIDQYQRLDLIHTRPVAGSLLESNVYGLILTIYAVIAGRRLWRGAAHANRSALKYLFALFCYTILGLLGGSILIPMPPLRPNVSATIREAVFAARP